ncbi:hypothetical protein Barb4_02981 [Bacteroidales bacterium Barb4]|nr:hypothetical protein Barb4_05056 [Bacteroidales bacterium Barb4]OAV66250.1 hypothetical protein Barb4_02981 [Bacteroidales bacterium Barb4]
MLRRYPHLICRFRTPRPYSFAPRDCTVSHPATARFRTPRLHGFVPRDCTVAAPATI